MNKGTVHRILAAVVPLAFIAAVFWIGFESFNEGRPRSVWAPQLIYGVVYVLLYSVSALDSWLGGPESGEFEIFDRATSALLVVWLIVSVAFLYRGFRSLFVVFNVLLAITALGLVFYKERSAN